MIGQVNLVTGYRLDVKAEAGTLVFFTKFISALGPIQSHIQWIPRVLNRARRRSVKLTIYLHLAPGLTTSGDMTPFPDMFL
jgi:hypothetical protein